jgi:G protein beta subunit-like protein
MYQNQDSTTLQPSRVFRAHKEYLTRLLLSPDIKFLATCSADHTVRIWKIDMNEENLEAVDTSETTSVQNSPTDASNTTTPTTNPNPGNPTPKPATNNTQPPPTTSNGTSQPQPPQPPANGATAALTQEPNTSTNPTGPQQSTSSSFRALSTLITRRLPLPLSKTLDNHQRWVWDCAFSADSAYLVTVSSDHYARLWELSSATIIRQYNGHHRGVICVALNDYSNPP